MSDIEPTIYVGEYSEPVMTRAVDGTVTVDWTRRGYKGITLVSDHLVDEWVATINENVRLHAELTHQGQGEMNYLAEVMDPAVERLQAEVERLRVALRELASMNPWQTKLLLGGHDAEFCRFCGSRSPEHAEFCVWAAAAALQEPQP